MIAGVDSNNSKICKIGYDSKYAINCKIGIHLAGGWSIHFHSVFNVVIKEKSFIRLDNSTVPTTRENSSSFLVGSFFNIIPTFS